MTEVCAAMGLTSLESLDDFVATNHDHYHHYRRELEGLPGVSFVAYDERERNNFHYVVLSIDDTQAGISRDRLIEILHAENILGAAISIRVVIAWSPIARVSRTRDRSCRPRND